MKANNSLQVVHSDLPEKKLPENLSPYVAAIVQSQEIRFLSITDKKIFLADCIAVATFIGGWAEKVDSDIKLMVSALLPDLSGRFSMLTESEIKAAFSSGSKGYYGENKSGLSVATCIYWLTMYQQDINRQNAKKEIESKNKTPLRLGIPQSEKRQLINDAYNKYLFNKTYHDYGNLIYGLLDAEGLITFTSQQKTEFLERGRKLIYERLQVWRDLREKRENEKKLDELIENDTEPIIEAKRLALLAYFEILAQSGATEITFTKAA